MLSGELYYLNQALDGKTIYGVNTNKIFNICNKDLIVSRLKQDLFLDDSGTLTESAYYFIKLIDFYKKAQNYITLNGNISISIMKSNYAICFINDEKDSYQIDITITEFIFLLIIKKYKKFWQFNNEVGLKSHINMDNFDKNKFNNKDTDDVLIIKKEFKQKTILSNCYYIENNALCRFDMLTNELQKVNSTLVRIELAKIFNIEVGDHK